MRKQICVGGALLPLLVASAYASVNIQTFAPAAGTSYVFSEDALMQVAPGDSTWTGERIYFHLMYNYDDQPLVEFDPTHVTRTDILINDFNTLDFGAGILPLKNLMIAINFPISLVSQPGAGSQFGSGDMQAHLKWRMTEDSAPVAIALIPTLYIPTGSQSLFLSNGGVGGGVSLAVERDFGPFRVSGNIGYRHFSNAVFEDINYSNQLPMSLSVYIPCVDRWGINLEAAGALSVPTNNYNNPGEFYAGGHFQATEDASLLFGASVGSIGGGGSGDFRVIAGVKFSPMDALAKKKETVAVPRPRPVVQPTAAPVVKPVVKKKPVVTKPRPKPSPKPSPKVVKKKPVKKKARLKKKPAPAKSPSVGTSAPSGVEIETETTVHTTTKVRRGVKAPAPPTPQSAPSLPANASQAPN